MTRRWWILWIVALLAACGVKLTVERHDKATIEVKPREKREDSELDKEEQSP